MFASTGAAVLVLCVFLFSNMGISVLGQSSDNTVEQASTQRAINVEEGSSAENIARNLGSFQDSRFNILAQHNNQLIEGISDHSTATNRVLGISFGGGNTAFFLGSDRNTVVQSNEQRIEDVKKGSMAENVAETFSELTFGSDGNTIDQSNTQHIDTITY